MGKPQRSWERKGLGVGLLGRKLRSCTWVHAQPWPRVFFQPREVATHSPSAFSSIPLGKCSLPRHESTNGQGRGAGGCRGSLHAGQPICPCVMVLSSPAFPLPAMENPLAGAGAGPEQVRAREQRARHKREQRPHLPHKRGPKCARPGEKERRGWREKGNGGGEANPHSRVCGSQRQGRAAQSPWGTGETAQGTRTGTS